MFLDRLSGYEVTVRLLGNPNQSLTDRTLFRMVNLWPREPLDLIPFVKKGNGLLSYSVLFPQLLKGNGRLLQILNKSAFYFSKLA